MPLEEFEQKFSGLKQRVLMGHPYHCTVVISLWGLQFKFPEDMLSNDIKEALILNRRAEEVLEDYKKQSHKSLRDARNKVSSAVSQSSFGARMCVLSCFNLVEAFVNGLAWDFSRNENNMNRLSNKKKKLIKDGPIREKLIKYPEIITGKTLWSEQDEPLRNFLEHVKPFRDSLVHPSPFSAPERYGGHDKLKYLYRIDSKKAELAAKVSVDLITVMFKHVYGGERPQPAWLMKLVDGVRVDNSFDDSTRPPSGATKEY